MSKEQIWNLARSVHGYGVEARRHLHRNPELSFQERETHAYLVERLTELGCSFQAEMGGGTGIKVVIGGDRPGPTVALRADIDALPIQEEIELEFASQKPGVMHACGHDVHTAILLATAKALKGIEAELPGKVVLIFQPGEEMNPGGASLMIKDGVLENPKVDAIFGLHVMPHMDAGTMGFGAGPMLASPDEVIVTIVGKGGHGAYPHLGVDPVLVTCQVITLLQQVVSRNVSPFQPAVITVGKIHGGTAPNVIPDEVHFEATVRTMDPQVRAMMPQRIEAVVKGVCEAAGASYRFRYEPGYPVLINDAAMTDIARQAAEAIIAPEAIEGAEPSMGGEDFAFYLEQVPGSFARIGSAVPGSTNRFGLHTSRLLIDEEAIALGVAYYLSVVQRYWEQAQ